MMLKQMSYKKIIICIGAAAVVIAVAVAVLLSRKEETFRSIMVYDVEGSAVIERESVGSLNAAENLYLESGDRVSVAQDSSMRMKLDDDKYVMAEADTIFSVEAEGSDENSRTRICLEQGAITNEIQHPLSDGSQYETSTPNSVMAVRGTIYRVELYKDENGEQNTKLCCFQGKVGTKPILPDGTYGEEVLVAAGSELIVYSDGTMEGPEEIAYEQLPKQAVQNLLDMSENGQALTGIALEDLKQFAEAAQKAGDKAEMSESAQKQQEDAQKETAQSDKDTKKTADADGKTAQKDVAKTTPKPQNDTAAQNTIAAQEADQSGQNPQVQLPVPATVQPEAVQQAGSSSMEDGTGEEMTQEENAGNDSAGGNQGNKDKDKPHKDKPDKDKPDKPQQPVFYTVKFMYNDTVFATQTVVSGGMAEEPILMPTASGSWNFEFSTPIQADTTITWN